MKNLSFNQIKDKVNEIFESKNLKKAFAVEIKFEFVISDMANTPETCRLFIFQRERDASGKLLTHSFNCITEAEFKKELLKSLELTTI